MKNLVAEKGIISGRNLLSEVSELQNREIEQSRCPKIGKCDNYITKLVIDKKITFEVFDTYQAGVCNRYPQLCSENS